MTSGLSSAESDVFQQGLDNFLLNNMYSQKIVISVKTYLGIAEMHPTRHWKALIPYFTIPILLKWFTQLYEVIFDIQNYLKAWKWKVVVILNIEYHLIELSESLK